MGTRLRTAVAGACLALLVPAAAAHATFPGANGKIVSQALLYDGSLDITANYYVFAVNQNGTGGAVLTGAQENFDPSTSPDGQKIVWACQYRDLCTMNIDGSGKSAIASNVTGPGDGSSFSPDGTKIAFGTPDSQISVMNANGTGAVSLGVAGYQPDWSPDGTKIAFVNAGQIYVMNPDGSGQTRVTDGTSNIHTLSWSPDGKKIAFDKNADVYVIQPDGQGETRLTTSPDGDGDPVWSPDGTKIAFGSNRDHVPADPDNGFGGYVSEIYVMNADGTGQTRITRNDLNDPPGRSDYLPGGWQPIPINTYPRPKGATPLRVPLVPASRACTTPNTTHGAPLSFGSCGPPQSTSGQLTTGTPDSNGLPLRMDASLLVQAIPGNSAPPQNEADVKLEARLNDVFDKSLNDYTGALRAVLPLRITDKDNTPSPGGPGAGTTVPFQFAFDIPCTPDPATNIGSDCSISTTADTLVPGTIKESLRTIWQVGRVRVDDAGPDGNPDTTADNTVFAVQGVFVP